MIPADKWPEWADRHCWDDGGHGMFFGVVNAGWDWKSEYGYSGIPLPPGHDWRVPVIRNQGENSGPVAWMRRNVTFKEGGGHTKGERITSEAKVYDDDLPLYAGPQPGLDTDLEQFRDAVEELYSSKLSRYENGEALGDEWMEGAEAERIRLLALIDGQAGRPAPVVMDARKAQEMQALIDKLQPTKGEGES